MTISLDTPQQISAWQFMSAISQLTLELQTGMNYYGHRGSVLKGIQARGWTSVEGRATKRAKLLALSELLDTAKRVGIHDGPVCAHAEKLLAETLASMGLMIERAEDVPVAG